MAEMIGNLIFLWGDNSMNERLKPCPFCGGDVTIYCSSATNGYYFMHNNKQGKAKNCILLTPSTICGKYKSLKDAYEAWNRRGENA